MGKEETRGRGKEETGRRLGEDEKRQGKGKRGEEERRGDETRNKETRGDERKGGKQQKRSTGDEEIKIYG